MSRIYILFSTILFCALQSFGQYNVQLLSKKTYSGQNLSGSWGYNDTVNHKEYGLIGTTRGLSIVDITTPTAPVEVKYIPGSSGLWRECQTYKSYAYITQDNNGATNCEGVLIYDLSTLPGGKVDTFRGTTAYDSIFRIHSLYIDQDSGFLYLNGGRVKINGTGNNGVAIYDLKPNPKKPTFVGFTPSPSGSSTNYSHDCYVRNNLLFEAHVYNNRFTVWDVSNKAAPVKLQDITTAYSTVHNMWLSKDSKTLFLTHEQFNFPVEAFDVSDLSNIRKLSEFKVNPTNTEIAHNVHVIDDNFAYTSYYSDGLAIFDISDPTNVITVGYYDTQPTSTQTEDGVWGAYGYYKSGVFTLSDMIAGLFVVKPTLVKAARIVGTITDTNTNAAIISATMNIVDTTITATTDFAGKYKTGTAKAGLTTLKFSKTGYITKYVQINLANGRIDTVNVKLRQIPFIKNTINAEFCQGSTYLLPNGNAVTQPGTYESIIGTSASGKDTIVITNLIANPSYSFMSNAETCNSSYVLPWGTTVSSSGAYQHVYSSVKGCDSTYTINVLFNPNYTINALYTICNGSSYNLPWGTSVSSPGNYQHTYITNNGCDSVININLSVVPNYDLTVIDSILMGQTYTLPNGNTVTTEGVYQSNLVSVNGCDSIIHTQLLVKDTTTITGIKLHNNDLHFSYNNAENSLVLITDYSTEIKEIQVFNSVGSLVYSVEQVNGKIILPNLAKDMYIIRAISSENNVYIGKIAHY